MTTLFLVQDVAVFSLLVQLCVFAFNSAIIKVIKLMTMRWAGRVAGVVAKRRSHRLQVVRPEERIASGNLCNKWDNNMKIVFTEILRDAVGSIKSGLVC